MFHVGDGQNRPKRGLSNNVGRADVVIGPYHGKCEDLLL